MQGSYSHAANMWKAFICHSNDLNVLSCMLQLLRGHYTDCQNKAQEQFHNLVHFIALNSIKFICLAGDSLNYYKSRNVVMPIYHTGKACNVATLTLTPAFRNHIPLISVTPLHRLAITIFSPLCVHLCHCDEVAFGRATVKVVLVMNIRV